MISHQTNSAKTKKKEFTKFSKPVKIMSKSYIPQADPQQSIQDCCVCLNYVL